MTQIFANRPELMPIGETTQEHKRWQEEESALVERDRATAGLKGGLFRGCFRRTRRRQWAAIRDDGDGVNRCPECLWELEDGICPQCSIPGSSDSDGHENWDDDPYGIDGASIEDVLGVLDEDARMGRNPNPDFSEHGYSSEDGSSIGIAPRVERFMDRRITRHLGRVHALPGEGPDYDSFLDDTDENSQDDEANSLDGFVVNDVEDGQRSTTSSARSLHWETDEGTDEEANLPPDYDNGRNSQDEDGSNETVSAVTQYDPEDESDEGPIVRSRRQVQRRSEASTQSSGSDGRGGSGVSQALNALRVRNGDKRSRVSANAQRNIPRRNPDTRRERSADGTIEIESDSESPVPAQHTWRRRRVIPNRPISDDDSEVEVSSGTATVGRDSPRAIAGWTNSRSEGTRMARQTNNASSPIRIESSPTRPTDGQFAIPGAFPQHSRPHTSLDTTNSRHISRTPARTNRGEGNAFRDTSTRPPPANASPSNGLQQRRGARRRSPLPPRTHPRSPTPTQSHSPTAMEIFEQGRRERQAQKIERRAERRRLKAEREMRGRPQSGLSLSPGSSNQHEDV